MSEAGRLERGRSALVVIDVQEAFRRYSCFARVAQGCNRLLAGARLLGVPRVVSEQYPRGLGRTVPEVGLEGERPLEKVVFSAARAEGFGLEGRDQALLCGLETHVCVAQTALDLLAQGVEVYLAGDALGTRNQLDHDLGLRRLELAGARLLSVEAALFEWLGGADDRQFKAVQGLIK